MSLSSVQASAKRALERYDRPATPARRGDLVAVKVVTSVTYAFGSGRGTERSARYVVGEVTHVSREGFVRGYRYRLDGQFLQSRVINGDLYDCVVALASRFNVPVATVLRQIPGEFDSLDALREALMPFRAAE